MSSFQVAYNILNPFKLRNWTTQGKESLREKIYFKHYYISKIPIPYLSLQLHLIIFRYFCIFDIIKIYCERLCCETVWIYYSVLHSYCSICVLDGETNLEFALTSPKSVSNPQPFRTHLLTAPRWRCKKQSS